MSGVWVHSPNAIIGEALTAYVRSLGFRVHASPEPAAAAVFDLTSFDALLPPPPPIPCLAMVRSPELDLVDAVLRLGYREVHPPSHDKLRFARSLQALLAEVAGGDVVRQDDPDGDASALTTRETQVLGLLMLGLSNKRIAARLGVAERTAKHHVTSLMRKHLVRSRWELLAKIQSLQPHIDGAQRAPLEPSKYRASECRPGE